MMQRCCAVRKTLAVLAVWAATTAPAAAADSALKQKLNEARAQADAALAAQEVECQTRFAVTPCLLDARARHREATEPIRRDLITLDERAREKRAEQRLQRVRAKSDAASAAAAAKAASAALAETADASKAQPKIRHRLRSASSAGSDAVSAEDAAQGALESSPPEAAASAPKRRPPSKRLTAAPDPDAAKRSAERVRDAEARRERVLKRNAERHAKKPPAAPLSVPGAPDPAAAR